MTNRKAEILAPAGSPEALTAAVRCGANAVYLGGRDDLNARRGAVNFSAEELEQAAEYCHARGVKVYIALNTLVRDDEMKPALRAVERACQIKADALILQDLGLVRLVREAAPNMPMHASTQMSVQTLDGVKLLADMGFKRAVLPRELSRREIEYIVKNSPLELELFVHGALCMCLSGQCLMSAVLGSRSGNRGLCAQPCRLPFAVEGGTGHDLSLKDMSLVESLSELSKMGISSFKIEGRMKRPEYVAAAVSACRESLSGGETDEDMRRLEAVFSRSGFTRGYYDGELGRDMFGTRRKEDVDAAKEVLPQLAAMYNGEQPLIPVKMEFAAKRGKLPLLRVSALGKVFETAAGEPAQEANNRATQAEELRTRLEKCGSTQFFAQETEITLDDGLFLSASQVNAMRRAALEGLEEKIKERPEISFKMPELRIRPRAGKNRGFVLRLHDHRQLPENLDGVRRVILPPDTPAQTVKKLRSLGVQPAVETPVAIFGGGEEVYNSLLGAAEKGFSLAAVSGLDGVALAKRAGLKACGLMGLNIFNSFSVAALEDAGVGDAVLSAELKLAQSEALGGRRPRGVFAYGRLPLMHFRSCPLKNGAGCAECGKRGALTDRKEVSFPVECGSFASTLLNSVPTVLSDKRDALNFADFSLLWFTRESRAECEKILNDYRLNAVPDGEFTRGLAFRGVE